MACLMCEMLHILTTLLNFFSRHPIACVLIWIYFLVIAFFFGKCCTYCMRSILLIMLSRACCFAIFFLLLRAFFFQGMNFVALSLLEASSGDDENAFWILAGMCDFLDLEVGAPIAAQAALNAQHVSGG